MGFQDLVDCIEVYALESKTEERNSFKALG